MILFKYSKLWTIFFQNFLKVNFWKKFSANFLLKKYLIIQLFVIFFKFFQKIGLKKIIEETNIWFFPILSKNDYFFC